MTSSRSDLHYLTISQAGELIQNQELSPVELTQAFLDRIQQTDDQLHSFITVLSEQALADARLAESEILQGHYKGPLHGIPFALKDLYDTAGIKTTSGSRVDINRIPTEDSTCTARLKQSGGILLGKLAMHEFALGGPDFTTPFLPVRNPWNLAHVTGGSSSGSGAAVASGQCMGALGSCTGGSIRGPASLCGIVGIKATYGRVSRAGVVTLSWSQDHCGPMTWTVRDAAHMLRSIAGYDHKDPTTSAAPVPDYTQWLGKELKGTTVGVPRHFFFNPEQGVNPETLAAVEKGLTTLEKLGANIEEVTIPSLDYVRAANSVIMLSEAFAFHEKNLKSRAHEYGEMVRARFRIGGLFTASDYVQAQRVRKLFNRELSETLQKVDVLVTPTMTQPAAAFEGFDTTSTVRGASFTAPFNLSGLPAISVPCGFTADGLPIGMQIAGKPFDEPGIFKVAYAYEQESRLYEKRPPFM